MCLCQLLLLRNTSNKGQCLLQRDYLSLEVYCYFYTTITLLLHIWFDKELISCMFIQPTCDIIVCDVMLCC